MATDIDTFTLERIRRLDPTKKESLHIVFVAMTAAGYTNKEMEAAVNSGSSDIGIIGNADRYGGLVGWAVSHLISLIEQKQEVFLQRRPKNTGPQLREEHSDADVIVAFRPREVIKARPGVHSKS